MTDKKPSTTIDEYISTFPVDIQAILEKVRQAIYKAAPDAVETMSYGIPTFDRNVCWLLGTSVRKTRCFLRTDVPRSQHRSSRRFTRSYEHRHLHMMVVPPRGALVALAQQSVRSGRAVVGRATSLQVLCDQLEHTRANLARLGYCHWTWWIIRSAPANTFRADFLLIRVYKSVLHPVGPRART